MLILSGIPGDGVPREVEASQALQVQDRGWHVPEHGHAAAQAYLGAGDVELQVGDLKAARRGSVPVAGGPLRPDLAARLRVQEGEAGGLGEGELLARYSNVIVML